MSRVARIAVFGVLALSPATAAAQPYYGGQGYGGLPFIPLYSPPTNPLNPIVPYRFTPYWNVPVNSIYGSFVTGQPIPNYYSPFNNITNMPFYNWYLRPSQLYGPTSSLPWMSGAASPGYMSGGSTARYDVMRNAQREYESAQRAAGTPGYRAQRGAEAAKDLIYEQWAYERLGVTGGLAAIKAGENQPEELAKALGADEETIATGDPLNHILVAIVAAEAKGAKGAKGPSAFLGPQILDLVRFSGSPAADAVNLVRQAGRLPFPEGLDDPKLKDAREQLEADFASAVAPLRDGKAADPARLLKVSQDLQRLQETATPVIRALPFEESTAARRFLNNFEKALVPLRAPTAVSLVNPAWAMDGTSAADLVKHMGKNKLLFGPAADGGTVAYLALHKALATYLFVLNQPPPKK